MLAYLDTFFYERKETTVATAGGDGRNIIGVT
jgi:hypothetical protein